MPPKPFPFPINVGTDLCSVPRIFSLLTKPGKAEPLLRQILTVQERNQLTHDKVVEPVRRYFKAIDRAKELRDNGKRLAGRGNTAKLLLEIQRKKTAKEHELVPEKEQEAFIRVAASNGQADQQQADESRIWSLDEAKQEIHRTRDLIQKGARFLAGRFAAKEAAKKAHRTRALTWHDIWIQSGNSVNGRSAAPQALIISESGSWEDAEIVPMNISHDSEYATAVCLSHEPGLTVVEDPIPTAPDLESGSNSRIDDSEIVVTKDPGADLKQEWNKRINKARYYDDRANSSENWLKRKTKREGDPRQVAMILDAASKKQKREDPRQVAMNLDAASKKQKREDEIFRKLMNSEEDEDTRFIQRTFPVSEKHRAESIRRTIFVGNIHPETTIDDLQATFAQFSSSVKAYLYTNIDGELLGTGAIVLEYGDEAATACQAKDQSELHGNTIRCLPWFRRTFRRFLQKGFGTDAVFLHQRQDLEERERALLEMQTVQDSAERDPVPKPLLESEPLPQPSSPQYILVRELFRIQDEYHNRRSRGIFVTGINSDATDDDLQKHFASISENITATIRRRKDGRSLGRGYVTFETTEQAITAREKMDGTLLLGGSITCQGIGSGKEDLGRWTKAVAQDLDKF